jgi:glycosyltransferase involved in cell wall biosynthesis
VSDAVYPFNKGGKERRLWEISRRLHGRGIEVHVYTMKWWDGGGDMEMDGVRFHAICKVRPLYDGERRSIAQAVLFGMATLKLIFADFDLLDVDHMPYFPVIAARLVCTLRRKRMIVTWHEVWGRDYWRKYLGRLAPVSTVIEWVAARMSPEILSVSEQTSHRLAVHLGVKAPIHTVPLGVDTAAIKDEEPSEISSDVLYAGRLLSHKNVDLLLEALALLREEHPLITGQIIGEGPERSRLEALCSELGLDGNVEFSDFLPGSQIYGAMKSATVFALPSTREGFGVVVLEANTCGLPVVTTDHEANAARHLIIEGQNGFTTGVDAASLAERLWLAITRAPTMDPWSSAVRKGYVRDWEDVASAVLTVMGGGRPIVQVSAADPPCASEMVGDGRSGVNCVVNGMLSNLKETHDERLSDRTRCALLSTSARRHGERNESYRRGARRNWAR